MYTLKNTMQNVTASAVLAVSAIAGTTAVSTTTVATTAVAVLSVTHSTPAEAALICRDRPIDTRHLKYTQSARYFHYQPMKKRGVFGKCKKAGGVKKIKMFVPSLASGIKKLSGGKSRFTRGGDCSGGGVKGRRLFHAACVAHDVCYASRGVSKSKCDAMFLKNMLKIAKHGPIGSRVKAGSFVTAVVVAHRQSGKGYNFGQNWAKNNYK